ncbi:NAD-dependent deacylase [Kordiimonas marina]|uniref:NAD-dependent deacylase n=1 Tax=Kordiimonas marina TaxID=2872312 RepID=UPI001FF53DBD|nr:NAD-dependent deacylase [Kordiimonas marina]MCJ9428354.1 NAD-dependent deacylase [Kordiimonas marina]
MGTFSNIVILTGAGISAESGIMTFRDAGGLWEQQRIEDVATPEAFVRDPARVQAFYNERRAALYTVAPNRAHEALARLEREYPGTVTIVTQNVDDLHERAGSSRVVHMHGELRKVRCRMCGNVIEWEDDVEEDSGCPDCCTVGRLRPHIVWFGEVPLYIDEISSLLEEADLFISIGTSGEVYPAAGFVIEVKEHTHTIEINLEPSRGASLFDECRQGPAGILVPALVDELLS